MNFLEIFLTLNHHFPIAIAMVPQFQSFKNKIGFGGIFMKINCILKTVLKILSYRYCGQVAKKDMLHVQLEKNVLNSQFDNQRPFSKLKCICK